MWACRANVPVQAHRILETRQSWALDLAAVLLLCPVLHPSLTRKSPAAGAHPTELLGRHTTVPTPMPHTSGGGGGLACIGTHAFCSSCRYAGPCVVSALGHGLDRGFGVDHRFGGTERGCAGVPAQCLCPRPLALAVGTGGKQQDPRLQYRSPPPPPDRLRRGGGRISDSAPGCSLDEGQLT